MVLKKRTSNGSDLLNYMSVQNLYVNQANSDQAIYMIGSCS